LNRVGSFDFRADAHRRRGAEKRGPVIHNGAEAAVKWCGTANGSAAISVAVNTGSVGIEEVEKRRE
jgi:hypothetical protein